MTAGYKPDYWDGVRTGENDVKWKPRRAEFPQGESFGWGHGSAHNPFKDPPRDARGVPEGRKP